MLPLVPSNPRQTGNSFCGRLEDLCVQYAYVSKKNVCAMTKKAGTLMVAQVEGPFHQIPPVQTSRPAKPPMAQ